MSAFHKWIIPRNMCDFVCLGFWKNVPSDNWILYRLVQKRKIFIYLLEHELFTHLKFECIFVVLFVSIFLSLFLFNFEYYFFRRIHKYCDQTPVDSSIYVCRCCRENPVSSFVGSKFISCCCIFQSIFVNLLCRQEWRRTFDVDS